MVQNTRSMQDKILGKKELLGWEMNYQAVTAGINMTKLWLNWWSTEKGITENKLAPIKNALAEQEKLLIIFKEMINKSK